MQHEQFMTSSPDFLNAAPNIPVLAVRKEMVLNFSMLGFRLKLYSSLPPLLKMLLAP